MIVNTITEAKTHFSALVERVLKGEEIIIKKAGKPVAVLEKYPGKKVQRTPGVLKGKIKIADDFNSLPDDLSEAFGMM